MLCIFSLLSTMLVPDVYPRKSWGSHNTKNYKNSFLTNWAIFVQIEAKVKKLIVYFLQRHLWDLPLWTYVRTGDQSTGPHQVTRD